MPTIFSMKNRIKLTIAKVEFTLKPLSVFERQIVGSHKSMVNGVEVEDVALTSFAYIKYALKGIKGVKSSNGDDYKLEFEELSDCLTDDCANEIFTLDLGGEFYHAIYQLRANLQPPKKLKYFDRDEPLKGVKLEVISSGGQEK